MNYKIITDEDINGFAQIFFKSIYFQESAVHGKLYGILNPILDRFDIANDLDKDGFKQKLVEYVQKYSFLSQVISNDNPQLEKLYILTRLIAGKNLLPGVDLDLPELKGDVSLQYYRLEKTFEGDISVSEGRSLIARNGTDKLRIPEVPTTLSDVIKKINEKFRGYIQITEADKIKIFEWLDNMEKDPELRNIARANSKEDFIRIYQKRLQEEMLNSLSDNYYLVSSIFSNPDLMKELMIRAVTRYYEWAATNDLPPIRPGTPAENRLYLRKTIQRCKGYIYWIDLYFGRDALEFLVDSFDQENVKEIKIFTSLYNNENQINVELRNRFEEYQKEMKLKGVSLEMRLISTKSGYDRAPHDRFIVGKNIKFNVPSFTTIIKGRFSEIKETTNDIPFLDNWNNKDSLDILKDWITIKEILNKTVRMTYNAICVDCKKQFQVNFKPDGRPLYCSQCRKKY